jgi:hypothetical protein
VTRAVDQSKKRQNSVLGGTLLLSQCAS